MFHVKHSFALAASVFAPAPFRLCARSVRLLQSLRFRLLVSVGFGGRFWRASWVDCLALSFWGCFAKRVSQNSPEGAGAATGSFRISRTAARVAATSLGQQRALLRSRWGSSTRCCGLSGTTARFVLTSRGQRQGEPARRGILRAHLVCGEARRGTLRRPVKQKRGGVAIGSGSLGLHALRDVSLLGFTPFAKSRSWALGSSRRLLGFTPFAASRSGCCSSVPFPLDESYLMATSSAAQGAVAKS